MCKITQELTAIIAAGALTDEQRALLAKLPKQFTPGSSYNLPFANRWS